MTPPPQLPARYYALLCQRAAELGVDAVRLLKDARIDPRHLQAANGHISAEQADALICLAADRSGHESLAFDLARSLKLSSHDILGYAMLSAPNLDTALRLLARYFSLIAPSYRMQYRCDAQRAEARFQPALSMSPRGLAFHAEAIIVALYDHANTLLLGQLPACSIHLPFAAPPHAARYRELGSAVVHFGEETLPVARIRFEKETVFRPLAMADANTLRMAEDRCATLLSTITRSANLADWVRMMLREAAEGQPSLEELATILNLSARTLERRLAAEDCGFRELARQARHARACTLLRAGRLSVTQIAYQLGYGDAANFTRAFRRDAGGMTPREYRDQALAGAADDPR